MNVVLVTLALLPLAASLACLVVPRGVAGRITLLAGLVSFALVLMLVGPGADRVVHAGFLRVDALSVVFLLPTGFLYAATAAYSIGYLAEEAEPKATVDGEVADEFARYSRLFYVGLNAFAWSMLCAPMANGLASLWIAIEVTTVISALLVALDDTEGATEAAWKYVLIASCGLGIGLLATIVMYYAGAQQLGQSYDLTFDPLLRHAAELPATPVRLAFVLAVIGFGTKVGLFPVHTWLPDAHAEAPTPVSALLSGSLLAVSFYAILRFHQVARLTLGEHFPQTVLLVFGVASLLLAAFSLFDQTDLKRLLAYSSVEHMGILAIGVSFGAPLALAGVLLHVLGHAAAKGGAFMGAGVLVRAFGTKDISAMRNGLGRLPWSGPLFLMSVLALCAMPPFSLFRSEFQIVAGGLQDHRHTASALLIVLVTLAFVGLVTAATSIVLSSEHGRPSVQHLSFEGASQTTTGPTGDPTRPADSIITLVADQGTDAGREPSAWMVVPCVAGVLVLLLLGIHPPGELVHLLTVGARELSGGTQ